MQASASDMAYEIIWLDEARKSFDAEMEYVYSNFGLLTLSEVFDNLHERVNQMKLFPRIGVRHEDLDYHGYEIRMLHVKKVSVVYAIIGQTVQNLYVWNNWRDPKRIAKV